MLSKKSFLIGLISVFIFIRCNTEDVIPEPDNLIRQEKMVQVLTDICKVEARFQRRLSIRGKNNSEMVLQNYHIIFKDYSISEEQFKLSYQFYEESPAKMQVIYDSVIVHLTKEQAILKEINSDSITHKSNEHESE